MSHTSWRAIFAWCSLYILITWVVGLCTLRETFRPVLIQRKQAAAVRKGQLPGSVQHHHKSLADVFRQDLRRPFTFLGTQPIIQVLSLFMGYLFGLNHLSITTFESVWTDIYNQTPSRAALNYISIAGGFILGSQITGSLNDRVPFLIPFPNPIQISNNPRSTSTTPPKTPPKELPNFEQSSCSQPPCSFLPAY